MENFNTRSLSSWALQRAANSTEAPLQKAAFCSCESRSSLCKMESLLSSIVPASSACDPGWQRAFRQHCCKDRPNSSFPLAQLCHYQKHCLCTSASEEAGIAPSHHSNAGSVAWWSQRPRHDALLWTYLSLNCIAAEGALTILRRQVGKSHRDLSQCEKLLKARKNHFKSKLVRFFF